MPTRFGRRDKSTFTSVGNLRHKVCFYDWQQVPDDCDNLETSKNLTCSKKADISPVSPMRYHEGTVAFDGERTVTHRVICRYSPKVRDAKFISWREGGKTNTAKIRGELNLDQASRFVELFVGLESSKNPGRASEKLLPV